MATATKKPAKEWADIQNYIRLLADTELQHIDKLIYMSLKFRQGRNGNAWPGDRAVRHEITPADRQTGRPANKGINFIAAICEIVFTPDTCPEPMSGGHGRQTVCIPITVA